MSFKRTVVSLMAAATITLTGPLGVVFAQATPDASPIASPTAAYDPATDPVLQLPSTPRDYDKTDWPDHLTCGLFGGDDSEQTLERNQPVADYLAEWLGIPVSNTTGTSYNAVIEAARAGRVDCYTVGPFAYILGVQEANAEAIAIGVSSRADEPVYDHELRPFYYSVISTWKGSGIETIDDLAGHTFSFVDPASTSGHLVPESSMIKRGVNPNESMETMYAGSHPTSGLAIAQHKVDAGATTENTVANMAREGTADVCFWPDGRTNVQRTPEAFKALYDSCPDGYMVPIFYSDPIPSTPFTVNTNLPASLKQAIKDALLATPQNPEFIATTGRWFVDPTITDPAFQHMEHLDEMYNPLRELAKLLDLDLKELE